MKYFQKDKKKISALWAVLIIAIFIAIANFPKVMAQKNSTDEAKLTPTESVTGSVDEKEVQTLKENIASEVAKLSQENERAFSGFVKEDLKDDSLTLITDDDKEIKLSVLQDGVEVLSTSANSSEESELAAVGKDDYITAYGVFIDDILNTNLIYIHDKLFIASGKITDIDSRNFAVDVLTTEKDQLTLDVERSTLQQSIDLETYETNESGFSKMEIGDTIFFVIEKKLPNDKSTTYSARSILRIPASFFQEVTPTTEDKKN